MKKGNQQKKWYLVLAVAATALAFSAGIVIGPTSARASLLDLLPEGINNWLNQKKGNLVGNAFTMTAYSNTGEQTLTAHGSKVTLAGNEVSDGQDSDGNTTYSLSSVVTVTMDGKEIESSGDTLIFAEDGLTPAKDFSAEELKSYDNGSMSNFTLFAQPLNRFKNFFGKSRVVVIKSQMGSPIVAYSGDSVNFDIADDLPKTTRISIDGKALYIHRANFQIIDTALL